MLRQGHYTCTLSFEHTSLLANTHSSETNIHLLSAIALVSLKEEGIDEKGCSNQKTFLLDRGILRKVHFKLQRESRDYNVRQPIVSSDVSVHSLCITHRICVSKDLRPHALWHFKDLSKVLRR